MNPHAIVAALGDGDLSGWLSQITSTLTADFSVDNLITILLAALGITIPFVIFWFAYRLITRKAQKSMKKGGL